MAMTAPTEAAVLAAFFDILFPLWFNLHVEPITKHSLLSMIYSHCLHWTTSLSPKTLGELVIQ
jgi:hypothetical protein